jgi:hypothetical protein
MISQQIRLRVGLWALLLVLVAGHLLATPFAALAQTGIQVYALQGTLRAASGQPFDTYLITTDGRTYGLFGATPAVDTQIEQYKALGATNLVKVWGTLYPEGRQSDQPEIVVDSITSAAPPAPSPTPTPVNLKPTAIVTGAVVNVRSGPGTDYPPIATLTQGTSCGVIGRNSDASWLQLQCSNGVVGWVASEYLIVQGNVVNVPVIAVSPPPAPSYPDWKGSYFNNRNLAGTPVVVRNDTAINFEWGTGSPAPSVPADNFSARYERNINFASGYYRFSVRLDDGVRVWLGNELIFDDWREGSDRTLSIERGVSGVQQIRIEYFEAYNLATLVFSITPISAPPPPPSNPQPNDTQWLANYWNNPDLAGAAAVTRYENRDSYPIDRNWGSGSPVPGVVGSDNWSGRWVGLFQFSAGDHVFKATSDDGVRVAIDNIRVIDGWYDGHKEMSNVFRQLGAGQHTITVEFYERAGSAYLQVLWYRDSSSGSSGGGSSGGGSEPSRDE